MVRGAELALEDLDRRGRAARRAAARPGARHAPGLGPRPASAARLGLARSWQRPPRTPTSDLARVVVGDPAAVAAAAWAATTLGHDGPVERAPAGFVQLIALAARGPAVALLDEPTDLPSDRLAAYVRGLAGAGTAVLVVDHRPEVVAAADLAVLDHLAAVEPPDAARRRLRATPALAERAADPAGVLSGGERRLLGWLVAAATDPRAVVLDRAGTGLDATALAWAHATVDRWLGAGAAVVVRPGRAEEHRWVTHRADGTPGDVGPAATTRPGPGPGAAG